MMPGERAALDLARLGLLDGPDLPAFDCIARLAAEALAAPLALVTLAEPLAGRLLLRSLSCPGTPAAVQRSLPLSETLCRHVLERGEALIMPDVAAAEPSLPLREVAGTPVAAYLGVPLRDPAGRAVGTLCAIADAPRPWSEREIDMLGGLAALAGDQIALRLALAEASEARAAAAAALARQEETERRFRDLAANVPGAIFRYLLRPDGSDAIEYMSPGCLDIWEIGDEELRGDPARLWEAIAPEDLPAMQASIAASAREMARWRHRWRITTPSGRRKWLEGHGSPTRLPDGGVLWNSLVLDVTAEVAAQERLNENMRLLYEAQKQESIGRLAGGMAHDVNNLLGVIMTNAELLLLRENAPQDPAPFLHAILRAAESGGELTRQLLSFARRMPMRPEPIDLNRTVRDMTTLVRRTLPENIAIETALMAGLWTVEADRGLLDSALLNLVLNARDAMPEGGRLTIETANMRVDHEYLAAREEDLPPGRYVMLAVTDTGMGVDEALLPSIFEPFVTTKGPERGTGLGLAMVQGFVRQSGGMVRVYSEAGRGACFKIYLPAAEGGAHPAPPQPQGGLNPDAPAPRLLLVEDQPELRRALARQLEAAGFAVAETGGGEEALALFRAEPESFALVLTDVIMTGALTGPRLVQEIRRIRPDLPAVFMSGYPHEANVHGNGLRPSDVRLTKPIPRATLVGTVLRALRQRGGA
ncbi:ATP-binding protein [Rubritepida flocculans]|uniref:ATP-binding protein n=1 Tax=Rubritepida flocculans TaxID=182403 RepID=UPI000404E16A|nr:ATP-binding protein [Rubritepida flocculans]